MFTKITFVTILIHFCFISITLSYDFKFWSNSFMNNDKKFSPYSDNSATPSAPCGVSPIPLDPEINGTFVPELGQVVWQVSIETKRMGTWSHACGGVVITKQAVLTTASCLGSLNAGMIRSESGIVALPKSGHFVRRRRSSYPGAKKPGQAYTEAVKIHPLYDKKTLANNLAIIRLSMPFDFVKSEGNISTICMPDTKASDLKSNADALFVSGWGSGMGGKDLRSQLNVRPVQLVDCPAEWKMNKNELCVSQGFNQTIVERCEGDIGGPLFTDNKKSGSKLLGIASRGTTCTDNYPFVFIDVFPYLEWIHEASKPYF